jgi:hypothetical protein
MLGETLLWERFTRPKINLVRTLTQKSNFKRIANLNTFFESRSLP